MPYSNHEASAAAWYALLWFSKYESYDSVCALNAAVSRYLKRTRRDGPTEKEGKELGYGYVFEWMQRANGGHRYSMDGARKGGRVGLRILSGCNALKEDTGTAWTVQGGMGGGAARETGQRCTWAGMAFVSASPHIPALTLSNGRRTLTSYRPQSSKTGPMRLPRLHLHP